MAEDDPTTSTEDPAAGGQTDPEAGFDDTVKQILAKERKVAREASKRASVAEAKAKQLEDAGKSVEDKAAEAAADAVKRAGEAEGKALRLEVALDKGLTSTLAKRLVGATREELEADADELLKQFAKPAGKGKDPDQGRQDDAGGGGGRPAASDMNSWMRTAVGRRAQ